MDSFVKKQLLFWLFFGLLYSAFATYIVLTCRNLNSLCIDLGAWIVVVCCVAVVVLFLLTYLSMAINAYIHRQCDEKRKCQTCFARYKRNTIQPKPVSLTEVMFEQQAEPQELLFPRPPPRAVTRPSTRASELESPLINSEDRTVRNITDGRCGKKGKTKFKRTWINEQALKVLEGISEATEHGFDDGEEDILEEYELQDLESIDLRDDGTMDTERQAVVRSLLEW